MMKAKMIYTVLVQLIGYVALLYKCKDFPKRMIFTKGPASDHAWIHIHNNAAKYIIEKISKIYDLSDWMETNREHVHRASITIPHICIDITIKRYNKPNTKRPYYALLGDRMDIIQFLSKLIAEIRK